MTGVGERVTANYVEVDRARGNIFFQRKFYTFPIPGQTTPPYRMETPGLKKKNADGELGLRR